MRIAVTAKGAGLGAWLDPVFETCLQIVVVNDHDRFEAWMNPYHDIYATDSLALARKLIEENVGMLITGSISPQASSLLREKGIEVLLAEHGSILELVEAARAHRLPSVSQTNGTD